MKHFITKTTPKSHIKAKRHNRMEWVVRPGRDHQLMLFPNPDLHTDFNFLPSHRGARTGIGVRHH